MALQKDIAFQGINLSYHKITDVIEDYRKGRTVIIMACYLNKEARIADVNSMFKSCQFEFNLYDLTRAEMYEAIKLEQDFIGALDV
jgi:ABC-type phosphate transport system ATPase subunit